MELQNSSVNTEILQNNLENPQSGQAPTPEELAAKLAQQEIDNRALQAEYTRNRQYMIDMALESAKANPNSITNIKDEKLQSTVVKQLYGVDNYSQLVAIYWDNFASKENEDDENDSHKILEREVKILKFNAEKSEVENALREFKSSNPQYFTSTQNEDKLRDELRFISGELPAIDRIRRAAAIAFTPPTDPTALAYQVLNNSNTVSWGAAQVTKDNAKESEKQKQIDAGRILLGLKPIQK